MIAMKLSKRVLLFIILALAGCEFQKNMLYYPDNHVPSLSDLEAAQLQFWPSGPDAYRGFISTVPVAPGKGTFIVFHGNAATASDRTYYVKALAPLGYRIILAEYPGYGTRKGEPGEALFVKDAIETLRLASEQYGGPFFLLGESLGSAVAAAVAKASPLQVEGVILITPWDSLLSVAKGKFPWLPVRLFLADRYDSIGNLKGYQGRIAVIGAEHDQVIPVRHAAELHDALPGNKRMWTIRGAGHNDWPLRVDRSWWKEITDFAAMSSAKERR
jgi:hypothetical protein